MYMFDLRMYSLLSMADQVEHLAPSQLTLLKLILNREVKLINILSSRPVERSDSYTTVRILNNNFGAPLAFPKITLIMISC